MWVINNPDNRGILLTLLCGQNFWDPTSQSEFHYNRAESCLNASWWHGEPVGKFAFSFGCLLKLLQGMGNSRESWRVDRESYVVCATEFHY